MTQRSDVCEALTRGPMVSSQAIYHWATRFLLLVLLRLGEQLFYQKNRIMDIVYDLDKN